jgi:hypothetical protein
LPNIRDLAAADMRSIIEDATGAGTPYTLIHDGAEYPVTGTFGDIGSLTDPISGEPVQGRAIEATVAAQSIIEAAGTVPARGWKARAAALDGKETALFVQRNEYDRTIGLCRLTLGLHLQEQGAKIE